MTILLSGREIIPAGSQPGQLLWLAGSGLVGLVVGDTCLYKAFTILGPRKASLLASSSPVFAAVLAWLALGQSLEPLALAGIGVTLVGVSWVINERAAVGGAADDGGPAWLGVLLGIGAALGQAVGLVMAKQGMGDNIPALNASLIRMLVAGVGIWLIVVTTGRLRAASNTMRNRRAIGTMAGASVMGPFLGIWLSLVAINYAKVGIASTLMSLTPVVMILLVRIVYREHPSRRAIIGTFIALAGVALIFAR
jgi:drug/metabolite transporter (DMT)-like permease